MSVEKLSISLNTELARAVRAAAAESEVSVSTWFSDAATARVRQRRLRQALNTSDPDVAGLSDEQLDALVSEARQNSIVIMPARRAA